jgi:signal transduction histidine kinase
MDEFKNAYEDQTLNGEQATVLIIDDKQANIFVLEKLLERPGRQFLSAENGNDGLKLALQHEPDLIILDVQMPEMDGFEVARILQSNKRTKDIPIIFASAERKEHHSIIKGFEEGAVDYLSKPLDPEVTRAKVSVQLKIQWQKKELIRKNISLEKAESRINQLNSELQRNLAQLETVNRELESFSYSVSHDLRAPLRIANGYSSILLEDYGDKFDADAKRMLGSLQGQVRKMNGLIDNLLQFSKLGRKELKKSEIDAESLVETVLQDLGQADKYKAEIVSKPLPPMYADRELITQVWINLLSNALKYSSKKENAKIEIGSRNNGNEAVYYVSDNGSGFDMKYADQLFGVFQRLHKSDEFEGVGIGLSIVKRIVTKHGGRVWAEAAVDKGATFYFSLPTKKD